MTRLRLLAPLAAAALVAAGCGGDDDAATSSTSSPRGYTAPTATTGGAESSGAGKAPAVANAQDLGSKPQIATPQGAPPTSLVKKDLVVGKGPVVKPGDTVTVQYVGINWSNGKEFDSSWDRGQPATFPLDQVIPGWTNGIPGMRVGGRRELVIPPDQAYGPQGSPPAIGPNETLVFVVDVKKRGG